MLNELSYLGISNVRDGTPSPTALPAFTAVAQGGVHFVLLESNVYYADQASQVNASADVWRAHLLETAVPGSVIGIEGSNEYTSNTYYLNGVSSFGNVSWGLMDDAALKAAVRADPLLSAVQMIAGTEVSTTAIPSLGGAADVGNVHVYGGIGQQLQSGINAWVAAAQASAPGQPVYITETGISSSGFNTSTWSGGVADPYTQGIIDTNALLDGYKAGAAITFVYELMDEPGASSLQEQHFGLFNADGTPKPAAVDIGNLTHILRDNGGAMASPGSLTYAISGLPSTASSLLLQKSSGAFDLVIWNGNATLYDGTSVVTPPTSQITITLAGAAPSIEVFDPVQGTSAIQTLSNTNTVTVGLSADPIIIQFNTAVGSSGSSTAVSNSAAQSGGVTISGSDPVTYTGTSGADSIVSADNQHNSIRGGDGSDSIVGGSGFNQVNGNAGDDTIVGRSSSGDWLLGGQGQDSIDASASTGNNFLNGNLGNDTLIGGSEAVTLRGGQGDDVIHAGSGDDWISGDLGNNTIYGGQGMDTFHAGTGHDVISGWHNGDHIQVDHGVTWQVTQVNGDVHVIFSKGGEMDLLNIQQSMLQSGWIAVT